MQRLCRLLIVSSFVSAVAQAQDSSMTFTPASIKSEREANWVTRRDLAGAGIGIVAVGLLSLADAPVARATQRPFLQNNRFLFESTKAVQSFGDPGAILISSGLYIASRITHRPGLADASKHAVMSIVASSAFTQSIKLSVGRARPNISNGRDQYMFHPFHGAQTDYNAMPSGHTTAAFAAAAAFSSELSRTHKRAGRIARPVLYGVAALVGGSRMYHNRHWLSDVATGALIGEVTARRIVKMKHDER